MDLIDLFWNFGQQAQLSELENTVRDTKYEAATVAQKTTEETYLAHAKRQDKLGLVCQAMWSLIQERTGLTERDLLDRVTELDLKDGVLDGKYTKPPVDCPKCGAKMSRKFNRCLFCGEEYSEGSAFDTV
jgi:hypothetical protein